MKVIVKELREITDSKELYESKPPRFVSFFIYILLGCLIFVGVWMYFGEIDIVAKGTGVVRPNQTISSIRSKVQGQVTGCYLEEGRKVSKGEVLLNMGYEHLEVSRLQKEEALSDLENEYNALVKLKDSIEQDTNLFSKENEKEYYERYVKYVQDYENLKNANQIASQNEVITTSQTQTNQSIYARQIEIYEERLKELEAYLLSIEAETNLFEDPISSYALDFENYLFDIRNELLLIEELQGVYELNKALYEEKLMALKDFEDAGIALENAKNKLIDLKVTKAKEIKEKIKETTDAKAVAMQEKEKLVIDETLLGTSESQRALSLRKYKTDLLVGLYEQIETLEGACREKKRELESIDIAIADCEIVAPIDGILHLNGTLSIGDLLSVGQDLATIIPIEDSLYRIEIFMPNREIAGIELGDHVKYKFDALPYREYGHLTGRITSISTDAKVNEAQGVSGYIVQGDIANEAIYSYKGETADIKVGMTCEAHVVTEQKKIFYYLLEKINLLD